MDYLWIFVNALPDFDPAWSPEVEAKWFLCFTALYQMIQAIETAQRERLD